MAAWYAWPACQTPHTAAASSLYYCGSFRCSAEADMRTCRPRMVEASRASSGLPMMLPLITAAWAWPKQPSSWAWSSLIKFSCLRIPSRSAPACLVTYHTALAGIQPALCSRLAPVLPSLAPSMLIMASSQQQWPAMLLTLQSGCSLWMSIEQTVLRLNQACSHRQHRKPHLHMRGLSFPQAASVSQGMHLTVQPRITAQGQGLGKPCALQASPCPAGLTASFGRWPPARKQPRQGSSMDQH